jgi:hypothetical protein
MPDTLRDLLHGHIGQSQIAKSRTALNEIEWDLKHGIPGEIEYADRVGMFVKNDGYSLETPSSEIDVFKVIEGQLFFLKEAA